MFGLRRLRGNPPCSLWLQSVHWTNCFTRRAHITVPPCKGTHGDRVAGDNTRSRHNQRHFSYYVTSLCAPAPQQHGAVACTLVKSDARYGRRHCGSNSVFEVTHSVNKYATNRFSFRAHPKNFVIASLRGNDRENYILQVLRCQF